MELVFWGFLGMGVCLIGLVLFDYSLVLIFIVIIIMGFFVVMVGVFM